MSLCEPESPNRDRRRDQGRNSSTHSLSDRETLTPPTSSLSTFVSMYGYFRLASSVLTQHQLCLPSSSHVFTARQCRLKLPARVVSAYAAPTVFAFFSSCCDHAFALVQHLNLLVLSFLKVGLNLNSFSCSFLYFFPILFSFVVDAGPGQVMFSYLFSTACICIYIHVAPSARHG